MIIETPERPVRKGHRQPEMKIQAACVLWLYNERPETRGLFWHTPNELDRPDANASLIARRRAEGIVKGVADCQLAIARGGYHGLFVEFKTDKGRQSEAQVAWQQLVEAQGYRYEICRGLNEFKALINDYLG